MDSVVVSVHLSNIKKKKRKRLGKKNLNRLLDL